MSQMPDLTPICGRLLEQLLVFLGGDTSGGFPAFKRLKSELGNQGMGERLDLNPAEMEAFGRALRDWERADADSSQSDRNRQLARLRFISWMETLHQLNPALPFDAEVTAIISEELGRKQVRALELIIRSLVTEKFGDQQALEQGLSELLSSPVVAKWKKSADPGDLLSGTTFSELASLFVNSKEYPHYSPLFDESHFLTFLKDKRKTIQNFLEDIRRIRNLLAHNKKVSNTQLSLMDLYYEELISPVQEAHDQGQTKVNPDTYLDVSREELEGYFGHLSEDIAAVQDDIAAFRASVESGLGGLKADTAEIKQTTGAIGKRQQTIALGVAVAILGIASLLYLAQGTQEDTLAIQATTTRIEQKTDKTAKAIADTARQLSGSMEEIRQGFSTLSKQGGIINQPERPEQFYHNARIYELRGDTLNARKSYEQFLAFSLDVIDPYLRYLDLLKAQEGLSGAGASYRILAPKQPGAAYESVAALLLEDRARIQALGQVMERHSTYAPAYYLMSQQYSQKQLGQQSLTNKQQEKQALEAFIKLVQAGSFQKYFIDKEMAKQWQEDAQARLRALSLIDEKPSEPPFSYTAMSSNSGWMIQFNFREAVRKFFYKLEDDADFIDNGISDYIDQRLNAPAAKTYIQLPPTQAATRILVEYEDINNQRIGPFEVAFNPAAELEKSQKKILLQTQNSWVQFGRNHNAAYLYFTHVQSYHCGIQAVHYGLGKAVPDTRWEGLDRHCNLSDPIRMEGDSQLYIKVSPQVDFVSVQLTFKDGTQSDVVKILRR